MTEIETRDWEDKIRFNERLVDEKFQRHQALVRYLGPINHESEWRDEARRKRDAKKYEEESQRQAKNPLPKPHAIPQDILWSVGTRMYREEHGEPITEAKTYTQEEVDAFWRYAINEEPGWGSPGSVR